MKALEKQSRALPLRYSLFHSVACYAGNILLQEGEMLRELKELGKEISDTEIEEPFLVDVNGTDPRVSFLGIIEDDELRRLHAYLYGGEHSEVLEHIGNFIDLSASVEKPPQIPDDDRIALVKCGLRRTALRAVYDLAMHERFPALLDKSEHDMIWVTKSWKVYLLDRSDKR